MKIEPIVLRKLQTTHTSFVIDLELDYNVTFICGESGVGKSAVFSFIQELSTEDKRIKCFNYLNYHDEYMDYIKNAKGKLFVIDNADLLLDDNMRSYIAWDTENQYILIGRNPTGLMLSQDEIYELDSCREGKIVRFTLKKSF